MREAIPNQCPILCFIIKSNNLGWHLNKYTHSNKLIRVELVLRRSSRQEDRIKTIMNHHVKNWWKKLPRDPVYLITWISNHLMHRCRRVSLGLGKSYHPDCLAKTIIDLSLSHRLISAIRVKVYGMLTKSSLIRNKDSIQKSWSRLFICLKNLNQA